MKTHCFAILLGVVVVLINVSTTIAKSCERQACSLTCANVRCRSGTHCVMVKKYQGGHGRCAEGPVCVNNTCADMTCTGKNGPNTLECQETEECVMREVVCIRAPCPPIAMCVYKEPPKSCESEATSCAVVLCPVETNCEVENGCVRCVPI